MIRNSRQLAAAARIPTRGFELNCTGRAPGYSFAPQPAPSKVQLLTLPFSTRNRVVQVETGALVSPPIGVDTPTPPPTPTWPPPPKPPMPMPMRGPPPAPAGLL